ncbi:MAG: M42 family metallopeptidase [Firmicutes bacterium]|nr:M42 family metallopeptidase [Bacillota bacterium]
MDLKNVLKDMSLLDAVSGNEKNMSEFLCSFFKTYCDTVEVDKFSNVVGLKKGRKPEKKIMVTSHYDEIGLLVKSIDEKGFIRFTAMGGVDPKILLAQEVIIYGKKKVYGVIGAKPPHLLDQEEAKKAPDIQKLYIDTGMNAEELKNYVSIGDYITFKPIFFELQSELISSKSFDNRSSLAAMLVAMEELSNIKHDSDIYFIATVQEEVHLTGATIASFNINPDIAVVLDVCSGETPDAPKERTSTCGKGPVIAKGPILNKELTYRLIETAKIENIPHQICVEPGSTGTEARATQVSRCGIPTVLISIPLKYMHTPIETISISDTRNCGKLVARFISAVEKQIREGGYTC